MKMGRLIHVMIVIIEDLKQLIEKNATFERETVI